MDIQGHAVLAILSLVLLAMTTKADSLRVGASMVDITPPVGAPQYQGPATGVDTPLYAKALVFEQHGEQGALLICDFSRVDRRMSRIARSRAAAATGIPFQNISVLSTHTHSGLRYDMQEYVERESKGTLTDEDRQSHVGRLIEGMVDVLVDAHRQRQDVKAVVGIGHGQNLTRNRRRLLTSGQVRWHGVRDDSPTVVRPAGPVDPDVHFVMFKPLEDEAPPFAALTVFACHPTTQFGNTRFHADFPHYIHETLRQTYGSNLISIFGNGTCGDLEAASNIPGNGTLTERLGSAIAAAVVRAAPDAVATSPDFKVVSRTIMLPLQGYTDDEYRWAMDEAAPPLYPESAFMTMRRRMKIKRLVRMREEGEASPPVVSGDPWYLPVEIQVFRLDRQTAIVTTPGHSFAELGLDLKQRSPFANTILIEFAHTNIGYTPPRRVFAEGGYQPLNSRLQPGYVETLFDEILRIMNMLSS